MPDPLDAELRYAYVSPLLGGTAVWADLGTGAPRTPDRVPPPDADLATAAGVASLAAALADATVITCFDVLDGLDEIAPLLDWLVSRHADATVVLSTAGSPNQVEELRRLVPTDAVVARHVPIRAAAIVPDGAADAPPLGAVAVSADAPAVEHLLAFGPEAHRLASVSAAHAADLTAERADARRAAADLAYLEARVAQLESP
jgi:hypothetical protein